MTVNKDLLPTSYDLDGSTSTFPIDFYFITAGDLKLVKRSITGVETTLTLNVNYEITGAGNAEGGEITLKPGNLGAAGERLILVWDKEFDQQTNLRVQSEDPAAAIERELDNAAQRDQQLRALTTRALKFPVTEDMTDADSTMVDLASYKGKAVGISETGQMTPMQLGTMVHDLENVIGLCDTVAELRGLDISTNNYTWAFVKGYTTANDGGGGWFYWDSASTDAEDYGYCLIPTSAPTSGRWKRLIAQPAVLASHFGFSPVASENTNTTAISRAFDFVKTNTAGRKHLKIDNPGTSAVGTINKTGLPPMVLEICDGVTLNGENIDYLTSKSMFELSGTLGTATTLTAAGVELDDEIYVADTTGLTVGMMIFIESLTEVWGGIAGIGGYDEVMKGEINWIEAINTVTKKITTRYPLESDYSITPHTVNVTPVTHASRLRLMGKGLAVGGGLKGKLDGTDGYGGTGYLPNGQGQNFLHVSYYEDVQVEDVQGLKWQNAFCRYRRCWNVTAERAHMKGLPDAFPTSDFYGHVSDGSHHVTFLNIKGENCRRPVDTTPTRITRYIEQGHIRAINCNGAAVGTHHAQHYNIHHCWGRNTPIGALCRGRDGQVSHSQFDDTTTAVIQLGSGNGDSVTGATAGRVDIANVRGKAKGGNFLRCFVSLDSLTSRNNTVEGIDSHAYFFRPNTLENLLISNDNMNWDPATPNGRHYLYVTNNNESLTKLKKLTVARNTLRGCTGYVAYLQAPNLASHSTAPGTPADQIYIWPQDSNGTDDGLLFKDGTHFGNEILLMQEAEADEAQGGIRNRLINGNFELDMNGWKVVATGSGAVTNSLSTTSLPPTGDGTPGRGRRALLVQLATAHASPAAGDNYSLAYELRGTQIQDLGWGGVNAKPIVLRIPTRHTVAGTYSGAIKNHDGTRSYPFTFTVPTSFTWAETVIRIPGDTSGTWKNDDNVALQVVLDLGSGSDFEAPANAWVGSNKHRVAGTARHIAGSVSDQYRTTGLELWAGASVNKLPDNIPPALARVMDHVDARLLNPMFMDDFLGAALSTAHWIVKKGSDGAAVDPYLIKTNRVGGVARCGSGADAGGTVALNGSQLLGGLDYLPSKGRLKMEARCLNKNIAAQLAFVGFTDQNAALEAPFEIGALDAVTANCTDGAAFVYDTNSASDVIVLCVAKAGTVQSQVLSGVTFPVTNFSTSMDSASRYGIEIDESGNVTFKINGAQVGKTFAAGVSTGVALCPTMGCAARAATQTEFDSDYIAVSQKR